MSCFWCQEESSDEYCTRCNAVAHTACLAHFFMRSRNCPVCKAEVRPIRRLDAARCALENATLEYGEAHEHVVIMRKLDVAIAMSHCGLQRDKQQFLEPLTRLKTEQQNDWLVRVSCLEHARASLALSEFEQAKRSLRPIWKLRAAQDEFLSLLFAEGLCIYAKASLLQGKSGVAWKTLQQALRISTSYAHVRGSLFCSASALRTVADCQQAAGSHAAAAETLRCVTGMLEQASRGDTYTIACARIDEGAAQIAAGNIAEARRLLRTALPELRKRKGGYTRTSEAALLLGSMIEPRERLCLKTHPEMVEEAS